MTRQDAVLIALLDGPSSRPRLEIDRVKAPISSVCMRGLLLEGWVTRSSATEGGIPIHVFTITEKGRAYAERLKAANAP